MRARFANARARAVKLRAMPYAAFISYCSEDKKIADAVCGTLEANRLRCWIAPRDGVLSKLIPGWNQ